MQKISTPIPYNIDIKLYIVSRTQDDSLNIVEQILPFFAPSTFVKIRVIDDPAITQSIPIVLNNSTIQDNWDENWEEGRIVINTLDFTMKGYLFGPVISPEIIKRTIANIAIGRDNPPIAEDDTLYNAELNPFATTEKPADPHTIDEFWVNN